MSVSLKLTNLAEQLNYLLWPSRCPVCGSFTAEQSSSLCINCWQKLAASTACDYCPYCGRAASKFAVINDRCPQCESTDQPIERIVRIGRYQDILRDIILQIKHSRQQRLTGILSYQLYCAALCDLPIDEIDYFVPVPLHWRRRLLRGYNQTLLLAHHFTTEDCKVRNMLIRTRNTHPQPGLTYNQRLKNVKGAFKCIRSLKGKNICLIDDIKTTGATLNECAEVLKQNGAAKVYAAVAAVAAGQ